MSMAATQLLWSAIAAAYVGISRWLVRKRGGACETAFAVLNVVVVFLFFIWDPAQPALAFETMALYLAIVIIQYWALDLHIRRGGFFTHAAFFLPILILIIFRIPRVHSLFVLTGISYLAFRTSYLVVEVRNGTVEKPGLWRYLGFAFFAPTLSVGPISPYRLHHQAFADSERPVIPVRRALLRVIIGLVKYRFLGRLCVELTYFPMLATGQEHHPLDVLIAAVAYLIYLYLNFSGFCDIAIGGAGLIGIPVAENFDHPFAARNIKEFWNRWHITLSHYLRDVVFSPMSKALVRLLGPAHLNLAITISVLTVFVLIGAWHGLGWNFVAFGLAHGLAVVANQYYTLGLKRWLRKDQFAAYNRSGVIRAVAVVLTFCYAAAALFLFLGSTIAAKTVAAAFGVLPGGGAN